MSRARSTYRCAECGHDHPKWVGRCEGCDAWNTVAEEPAAPPSSSSQRRISGNASNSIRPTPLGEVAPSRLTRWKTGLPEFDFVMGGGIVPGSLTLLGGEPGIGKSTILLQVLARLEAAGVHTLYASGEESPEQVRLRADRLEETADPVLVLADTRLEAIISAATRVEARVLVVDSIQTAFTDALEGAPGSVGQVRESAALLMRFAKASGTAVILVGHVTKGGNIAGPKTLEHIVDTVLYFEGEAVLDFRLLRATKNRFGSVDELGVFSMSQRGLIPVPNPSSIFLGARGRHAPGTAVTALMEGSRPVLVEIQALASASGFGTPQRVAAGLDPKRLAVLLAILERRAGAGFGAKDVFVQVTGGLKLTEPGADLAIAAALLSSLSDMPTPPDAIYLGELSLSGEIRPTTALDRRLTEAGRLGFRQAFGGGGTGMTPRGVTVTSGVRHVGLESVDELAGTLAG